MEYSEEEKRIKSDFEAVCRKLNMDQDSMDAAWASYDKIKDNYTLEVRRAQLLPSSLLAKADSQLASHHGRRRLRAYYYTV